MRNKIGYLNEGFFGTFDEDEFKDLLADEVTQEVAGVRVPQKLSDIDNYRYKFEFYFSGMKYSKIPALNIKRFAAFKNWFMYAVDNCYIFDDYEEPIFCAYQFGNSWHVGNEKTNEIMRFGDVLFNNTEYDINHRIFWDDTDSDPKKHKYGNGYLKFTFAFNASCRKYSQVMRLLTTLCIIFEKGSARAFNGKKKDGSIVTRCQPQNIRDIDSGAQISLWDIHDIARRTKKSFKTFAKWCDVLAGLKKSKEMMNYYNKTEIDDKLFTLYRYLECQFDEIHKIYSDDNKTLTLELHTTYKPKKIPKKLVDKTKSMGYDLKIIPYTGDNKGNVSHLYNVEFYVECRDDIKAIESMLSNGGLSNKQHLQVDINIRSNDPNVKAKSLFKHNETVDLTTIQSLCERMYVNCCYNGGYWDETDTSSMFPKILVKDLKTQSVKQLRARDNYSRSWRSTTTYNEPNTTWNNRKYYMYF